MKSKPNILLVLSDQERQRDWLPQGVHLPARSRLIKDGIEFTNHYTHTSPCSPARASLFTGRYMEQHGVSECSDDPANTQLPTDMPNLGHMLREVGYKTAFKGKWHLQPRSDPEMEKFGFSDWEGDDDAWKGAPGSGTAFDDPIADQSVNWLRANGSSLDPWFLTVSMVNPHDIMWFPIDQRWWQEENPEYATAAAEWLASPPWLSGRSSLLDIPDFPAFGMEIDEWFSKLPENFHDDLYTKPEVHRRWSWEMLRFGKFGEMDRGDTQIWLRLLDYYVKLHELNDLAMVKVFDALDEICAWDDTVIIFSSDHGDQCGSHGLRSKGPWNYQETMRIPLYMKVPGKSSRGTKTSALTSHVDLAATIAELAGVNINDNPNLVGESLLPLLDDQDKKIRDYVLFSQRWPWYSGVEKTRYASSGIFDGRQKYCRYYGIGGGVAVGGEKLPGPMLFDRDANFEDHDHEWYDLQEDPYELVNLANDRGRRNDLRSHFEHLLQVELTDYAPIVFD